MDQSIDLAVIGGTGVYALEALSDLRSVQPTTAYGDPSAPLRIGRLEDRTVAFMARHGEGHHLPPHRINYRANLRALFDAGVRRVLAVNAVGGIGADWKPAALGVPDQLIDYTWGRAGTYCGDDDAPVVHVDMTEPYSAALRATLLASARARGIDLIDGGCYGVTQGPRLETRAEIRRLARDGCAVVGMTGMPEAALARELGIEYACLAMVANWAPGCDPQPHEIGMDEVYANLETAGRSLPALIAGMLQRLDRISHTES